MSVITTCDRCKKQIPYYQNRYEIRVITEWFHNGGYISDGLDLCPECEEDFKKWLEGKIRNHDAKQ